MNLPKTLKSEFKYWEKTKGLINNWNDTMVTTNGALRLMNNWILDLIVQKYSISIDFDNRWTTWGSIYQIVKEFQSDLESIFNGVKNLLKKVILKKFLTNCFQYQEVLQVKDIVKALKLLEKLLI